MLEEIWRSIKNFPPYEISSNGHVRSWKGEGYLTLKPCVAQCGYRRVVLYKDKKGYTKRIHRLVLEAFIGLCPNGYQANHKDGNKMHDVIENLEWVTPSSNICHAYRIGLIPQRAGKLNPNAKLNEQNVWLIKRLLWLKLPAKKIAIIFEVKLTTIYDINAEKRWSHVKFVPTDDDKKH